MIGAPIASDTFNPTALLNMLVGAGRAAGVRDAKSILKGFQEGLRDEIDKSLPVLYLLEPEVIVDSTLNALSPNTIDAPDISASLGKFLVSVSDPISGVSAFTQKYSKGTGKNKTEIIEPGDSDVIKLYTTAYNKLVSSRDTIIKEMHTELVSSISSTIEVWKLSEDINKVYSLLTQILDRIVAIGIPINKSQSGRITQVLRSIGRHLRKISKNTVRVLNPELLLDGIDSKTQVLIFAPNFNVSKKLPNDAATKILKKHFESVGINVKKDYFSAGYFAAAGHSALNVGGQLLINTPQLQTAKVIIAQAGLDAPGITQRFVENTGHLGYTVTVNKNYSATAKNSLSLGISFVRSQPFIFNSGELSSQETSTINSELQNILNISYRNAVENIKKAASTPEFYNYIVTGFRSSPTLLETINSMVINTLSGGKAGKPIKANRQKNFGNPIKYNTAKPKSIKSKSTHSKRPTKPKQVPITSFKGSNSLVSLQILLNANLAEKIKQNMGSGNRRDILNLRTGRFAESAKVERLSESRAGMITVFYSYMKNPYQTFEPGYRQGSPSSRNPKLLIAKSIREIAGQMVANRLRSVSV